jgi:hypothetical protein
MALPSVILNVQCIMTQIKLPGVSPGEYQGSTAFTGAEFILNFLLPSGVVEEFEEIFSKTAPR